jgi:hypothetical protein
MYNDERMRIAGSKKIYSWAIAGLFVCISLLLVGHKAFAQVPSDFSLQVSPSPLVTTVKPGQVTDLELKVRNFGTGTEQLKVEPRKFTVNKTTGEIEFDDTALPDIAPWVSFQPNTFSIDSGEVKTVKVHIALPKQSGFSYSFGIVISRANNQKITSAGRLIKGSVAVFALINVDRPGATKKLDVENFSLSQQVYEYLPAELKVTFKNVGNTIVQPYGNIFIQRGSSDTTPISTLPVNSKSGYLLPDTSRLFTTEWSDGFPVYKTTQRSDGTESTDLTWDWSKLTDFRIGPYTAKLVAVYNDGQRDVAVEREVTFWVFPWKTILGIIFVLALVVFLMRKLIQRGKRRAVQKALAEREKNKEK